MTEALSRTHQLRAAATPPTIWAILPLAAERKMQKLAAIVLFVAALGLECLIPQSAAFAETKSCTSVDAPRCFIDLKTGIRMAYVEVGPADGRIVVLLHGLTDSARSWALSMAALHELDPSLHIIAVDQRGMAKARCLPAQIARRSRRTASDPSCLPRILPTSWIKRELIVQPSPVIPWAPSWRSRCRSTTRRG